MDAHARHVHELREVPIDLRRRIEETVERLIDILDLIDAPTEDLEDDECEDVCEDEGAQCDDEGERDGDADLGWPEGCTARADFYSVGGGDEDFVTPETSGGFVRPASHYGVWITPQQHAWMLAQFDPRIARRPQSGSRIYENHPVPRFPHEPANRPPFDRWREIPRLLAMAKRLRRERRKLSKVVRKKKVPV